MKRVVRKRLFIRRNNKSKINHAHESVICILRYEKSCKETVIYSKVAKKMRSVHIMFEGPVPNLGRLLVISEIINND